MAERIKVWLERSSGAASDEREGSTEAGRDGCAKSAEKGAADGASDRAHSSAKNKSRASAGAPSTVAAKSPPRKPTAAERVERAQATGLQRTVALSAAEKKEAAQAQAAGLRAAAERGVPFCEECERARKALAEAWRGGVT